MKTALVLIAGCALAGCSTRGAPRLPHLWGAEGERFAVAADHPLASSAGITLLEAGGNVVDAAVATSLALAVLRPYSTGLGGGGFMLLHRAGEGTAALDYRETAPSRAEISAYLDPEGKVLAGKTVTGAWAAGIPGLVRGLALAHQRHGSKPWAELFGPAIALAEHGFPVDEHTHQAMLALKERLAAEPDPSRFAEVARIFLKSGEAYAVGDHLRQTDLAASLRRLAREGPEAFYRGPIASAIAAEMLRLGGPMTAADLAAYEARGREPLRGAFRGFEVVGMPPPSSGGACLIEILQVMDGYDASRLTPSTYTHVLVEAFKHAFSDRAAGLGDADHHPAVAADVGRMVSAAHARRVRRAIRMDKTFPPDRYGLRALKDDRGTTHYSILTAAGDAVAASETINTFFGSLVVPPGTGIVLNNELDDFAVRTDVPNEFGLLMSERNRIRPGQRPLSSMAPTLLLKDGKAVLAAGASGGPRIITATVQTLLRAVDFGERLDDAVAAPRLHHQWSPDRLYVEGGLAEPVRRALASAGHSLVPLKGAESACQAVQLKGDRVHAASDPRKGGRPAAR